MEMNAAGSVYDTSTSPPLVSQGATGPISGGILRPGSIDQGAFLQALAEAQENREAAGVGGKPVGMPVPAFQANIPTLTSAQFAALVGAQAADPSFAAPDDGAAADPQAVAQGVATQGMSPQETAAQNLSRVTASAAAAQAYRMQAATAMKLTGRPAQPAANPAPSGTADTAKADQGAEDEAPVFTRIGQPTVLASADAPATAKDAATPDAAPVDPAAKTQTASADAAQTAPSDPNVVHLKDAPDRDTQRNLMAQHKRWIVDETPGARQLFFGPDGKFGWDDFLDVINPLQHIPIIAQIYRAVTGDQISGAAELIGSLPFGPLGVIGTMGTVADLAVKDTTGKDIGENLEAMVFGTGSDKKNADGTATDGSDLAEATPVHPDLGTQTASAASATDLTAQNRAHDMRRA
jgi:hypothetical protein